MSLNPGKPATAGVCLVAPASDPPRLFETRATEDRHGKPPAATRYGVVAHLATLGEEGELPGEQAQRASPKTMGGLRYEWDDHLGVNEVGAIEGGSRSGDARRRARVA